MTAGLGAAATWGAAAALATAAVLALRGRPVAASRAHRAGTLLAVAAVGCLAWALATGDFTLAVVAETSQRASSWPYRLAGLWGGMAGSLLLWSTMVAAWGCGRRAVGAERAALAAIPAATLLVGAALASPWDRLASPALDGEGLTPILEHPAMLVHPPVLYAGLTGLVVPFARVVGGRLDGVRRRLLAAVALLTAGMAIGAHWAYAEVGWGGFWAWDPVENTALLPWLAALAGVHLLRGGRAAAGAAFGAGAFLLAMVGTVLTRSGATPSVHAFAEDAAVGRALVAVAAMAAVAAAVRLVRATPPGEGRPRWPLRVQPWLAGSALAIVLLGTVRPLVGDAAVAVDGSFYSRFVGPLAVAAAVLVVAAGAVRRPWTRPSALAHAGFLVLLAGVLGSTAGASTIATLGPGEAVEVGGWEVRNDGVGVTTIRGRDAVYAELALLRDGDVRARLRPALVSYPERADLLAETALRSTPVGDVLAVLHDGDDAGRALVEVHVRPLVLWVWWGALVLAGATAWAAYTTASRAAPQSVASSERSSSLSTA